MKGGGRAGGVGFVGLAVVWLAAAPVVGQQAQELEHVATFPEGFGFVQTVRPMPDGRVLVADGLGRILALVDMGSGTMEPVGREGPGPGEWGQPDAVYPLPGDSTLLVDLGNTRIAVLDPSGEIAGTYPMVLESNEPGPFGMEIIQPSATDGMGRVYYQARGQLRPPDMEVDSSKVKRWVPGAQETDVVASLTPPAIKVSSGGGVNDRSMQIRQVPLAPQDAWAVAGDGAVAVVVAEPYHVEWHRPDGRVVRGPTIEYRRVPIRGPEKERYLDERDTEGLFTEVSIDNGARTVGFHRGAQGNNAQERARELRDLEWPESLPPFRSGGAIVAPDGRLWVRRFAAAGDPTLYDLFDRSGRRVATARLPQGRRVIGFDDDLVYAVRVDELGLNWLETYR